MQLDETLFQDIISKVDRELASKNTPVPARPIQATIRILQAYHASGPIINPSSTGLEYPVTEQNLHNHTIQWYEEKYGENIKIDPSPGHFPILIEGAAYQCRLPLVVGNFIIVGKKGNIESPSIINAVDFVQDLPEHVRERLDGYAEGLIQIMFKISAEVLIEIGRANTSFTLAAATDILQSCELINGNKTNYSMAEWHAQQFTEKILKHFISFHEEPEWIHDIEKLKKKAVELGYEPDSRINWDMFDVNQNRKYDPSLSDIETAVSVNHEAWRVGYNVLKQI